MCSLSGITLLTQLKLTYVIQSCSSFSLRSPVPLNEYTTLPVSEHLGCFQFIDIINSAALNTCILIHVSWYTISLGVEFAGLLNMWMFNLGKQFGIVLQWLRHFTLSPAVHKDPLDPPQHSVLSFWTFASGLGIECYFIVVLICASLFRMRSVILSPISHVYLFFSLIPNRIMCLVFYLVIYPFILVCSKFLMYVANVFFQFEKQAILCVTILLTIVVLELVSSVFYG